MRLFSSSGFFAVDFMDGELHLTPITAFTSRDDDDRRVEPITQSGDRREAAQLSVDDVPRLGRGTSNHFRNPGAGLLSPNLFCRCGSDVV